MYTQTIFNFLLVKKFRNIQKKSPFQLYEYSRTEEWRRRQNYKQSGRGGERVGILIQPQNPSRNSVSRHPSNSSERDASYALEGLECSNAGSVVAVAVTGVSSPASSRLAVSHNARGRRQKVVAAQACSRDLRYTSRAAMAKKKRKKGGGEEEGWRRQTDGGGRAKFGRRAALKWRRRRGIREKKKIHIDATGEQGRGQVRGCMEGADGLPFKATHEGANNNSSAWQRPSYRPSRFSVDILVPFSHPLPTLPPVPH